MNRFRQHKVFIEALIEADQALFKAMIKASTDERIDFIGKICKNVLAGIIKLKPVNKTDLSTHAHVIRSLASRKFKTRTRRQLIIKYSPVIATLLKDTFKKIFKSDMNK